MKNYQKSFIKNLKILLFENNKKPADLEKELILKKATISSWFNLKSLPNLKSLLILADYFNTSIDYLVSLSYERYFSPTTNDNFYHKISSIFVYDEIDKKEFLSDCEISGNTFSNWKKGDSPSFMNLIKMSKVLNLPIEYIIGRTDKTVL